MGRTSIIIHGHFYQPPRENPYTGIVPFQSGAKPYSDWNEAIYTTCYRPNAVSRYLSSDGRIENIYNNYASMSSNMGQTLLDWIEQNHPVFLKRLKRADEQSTRRFGHSSLMAQGFNHTIMPLDNMHTKRIQTVWAIESYRARFGHDPEGFWLAECAIDAETVDVLAENGIKFVILAPWQGIAIDGKSLNGKPMPCDRPFIIEGNKGGRISAFFYNGEFASGVSFGHYLRNADDMFEKLQDLRKRMKNPSLISWATDGEIYGHHEPFGDMGLAALVKKIEESKDFELDNFASYLEKHPATEVAALNTGDDGRGSSWSCAHGVGRWMRNCGCHTGGDDSWNQNWRGPLRKAFNNLEDGVREALDSKVREILGKDRDYKDLTLSYKAVVAHTKTVEAFVSELRTDEGKALSDKQRTTIASLLEAFRATMFTYTSCGWFFNDLSGIEPRQNMAYGVYAARLVDRCCKTRLNEKLLQDLSEAESNIESEGNGADLAKRDLPDRMSHIKACSYFAMNRRIADPKDYTDDWGNLHLVKYGESEMKVMNKRTLTVHRMSYTKIPYANGAMGFEITDLDEGQTYRSNVLKSSEKSLSNYTMWVEDRLSAGVPEAMIDNLAENIGNYLILVATDRSLFKETIFTENIGTCIKAIKSLILDQPDMDDVKRITRIRQLLYFVRIKGRPSDIQDISDAFTKKLDEYAITLIRDGMDESIATRALDLLEVARSEGFTPGMTYLQDAVYVSQKDDVSEDLKRRLAEDLNFRYPD